MIEKIEYWSRLGYNGEDIKNNNKKISIYNLNILINIVAFTILVCVAIAIFYAFYDGKIYSAYISIGMAIGLAVLLSIAIYFRKVNVCYEKIDKLIVFSVLGMYLYAIYLGTFQAEGDLAVTAIVIFIFLQVIFIWSPPKNLIIIVSMAIIFIICSFYTKDIRIASYDSIHCILVICCGNFISWKVSRVNVEYFMAEEKLLEQNKLLYMASTIDELTKMYNRKKIVSIINDIGKECIENNEKLVFIIMDIDNFKSYNDTYGHPAGDILLESAGCLLKDIAKKNNINVGRLGGEEFIAVWKASNLIDFNEIAEEIKVGISEMHRQNNSYVIHRKVTISQGVAVYNPQNISDIKEAYHLADKALYIAKKNGKNTVVVS